MLQQTLCSSTGMNRIMSKLESAIQSEILKKLNKLPKTFAFKVNPPPNGIPDIHCLSDGVPYYFEVKRTANDKARKLQQYRIEQLREAGGVAEVVTSYADVVKYMSFNKHLRK